MPKLFKKNTYRKSRQYKVRERVGKGMPRALRGLLIVLGAALLVIPVLLLAHPISYVPLIMVVLTLLVSWLYLRVLTRSVTVKVAQDSYSCARGEKAGFAVTLSNRSFLPAPRIELQFFMTNLFGEVDNERTLVCSLSPRQTVDAVFDANFVHLGKYEAGIRQISTYDLLGIFSKKKMETNRNAVLVRPAEVSLTGVNATQVMPDESQHMLKPIASDNEDYSSVREYHRGDPMKTVHWNLSSRNPDNKLYTRLYEEYVNPALVIVIDCYSPDYDSETQMSLFDGIVESAAALCLQAQRNGIEAEVRFIDVHNEQMGMHLASDDDVMNFIDKMHRITPVTSVAGESMEVEEMLRSAGLQSNGFGNVAFVTSRADEGCLEALRATRMRRRNTLAFVAMPRDLEDRERREFWAHFADLESVGIVCYGVESTPLGTEVSGL